MAHSPSKLFRIFIILSLLFINNLVSMNGVSRVSANSTNQQTGHPCGVVQQTASLKEGPIPPKELPFGTRSEDADWPVASQETFTEKDASGKDHTITVTVRRNPKRNIASSSDSVVVLPAAIPSCTYQWNESIEVTDTRPAAGGLTQYLKNYYNLYQITTAPGVTYKAYHTYRTELRWTRTNSNFSLSQPSVSWFFRGADCTNIMDTNTQSGAGFTPNWSGGNVTSTYIWDFMNAWPTRTPVAGNMHTLVTTTGYQNGVTITPNLSTVIYYSE